MRRSLIATIAVLGLVAAACGDDGDDGASAPADTTPATEAPADTTPATDPPMDDMCATGKTITDGVLTIATGEPAFPPYVVDNDPTNKQGFEAAVGWAVAAEMGFDDDVGHLGPHHLRRGDPARGQELRLQPPAVLDHPRAAADRHVLRSVLHQQPGDRRSGSDRPPRVLQRSKISRTSSSVCKPAPPACSSWPT